MMSALAVNSQPAVAHVRLEPRVASRRLVRVRAPRGRNGGARDAPIDPSRYFPIRQLLDG